jgi:hypothetical protein
MCSTTGKTFIQSEASLCEEIRYFDTWKSIREETGTELLEDLLNGSYRDVYRTVVKLEGMLQEWIMCRYCIHRLSGIFHTILHGTREEFRALLSVPEMK